MVYYNHKHLIKKRNINILCISLEKYYKLTKNIFNYNLVKRVKLGVVLVMLHVLGWSSLNPLAISMIFKLSPANPSEFVEIYPFLYHL